MSDLTLIGLTSDQWQTATIEIVAKQLETHDIETVVGWRKITPLYAASFYNRLDLVKYLIEKGANINAPGTGSPLLGACDKNNLEVIKYLIENGANIAPPNQGNPLSKVIRGDRPDKEQDKVETIKYLLDKGANVHFENDFGANNLVNMCVSYGYYEILVLLKEHGAKIQNKYGRWDNLMDIAVVRKNQKIIELLRGYGFKTQDEERKEQERKEHEERLSKSKFYQLVSILPDDKQGKMRKGRLLKWGADSIRYNGDVMTREDWVNKLAPDVIRKKTVTWDNKKPSYRLYKHDCFCEVPKMVYDLFDVQNETEGR